MNSQARFVAIMDWYLCNAFVAARAMVQLFKYISALRDASNERGSPPLNDILCFWTASSHTTSNSVIASAFNHLATLEQRSTLAVLPVGATRGHNGEPSSPEEHDDGQTELVGDGDRRLHKTSHDATTRMLTVIWHTKFRLTHFTIEKDWFKARRRMWRETEGCRSYAVC